MKFLLQPNTTRLTNWWSKLSSHIENECLSWSTPIRAERLTRLRPTKRCAGRWNHLSRILQSKRFRQGRVRRCLFWFRQCVPPTNLTYEVRWTKETAFNYPYASFHLEAQQAKKNLTQVFQAEPDAPTGELSPPNAKRAHLINNQKKPISDRICRKNLRTQAISFVMRREIQRRGGGPAGLEGTWALLASSARCCFSVCVNGRETPAAMLNWRSFYTNRHR